MADNAIRQQVEKTRKLFEALAVLFPTLNESCRAGHASAEDQLARFRIWAGNIGVNAKLHASLDYRLRDSKEARELTLDLLEVLHDHIRRGISFKTLP